MFLVVSEMSSAANSYFKQMTFSKTVDFRNQNILVGLEKDLNYRIKKANSVIERLGDFIHFSKNLVEQKLEIQVYKKYFLLQSKNDKKKLKVLLLIY